jgi:ribose/xylose/arabinose/galactoside ABC-type transport system permease subunit
MIRVPRAAALPVFFVLTVAFFCIFAPRFATASNFENLLAGYSFVAIVAIGQTFPILLRGIDLSVGAIVALAGMVMFDASLIALLPGWLAMLLGLATATLAGALNGWLVVGLRLQPFIATLATLAAYRGLVYALSGRQWVPELSTTPLTDPWIVGLETYFELGQLTEEVAMPAIPLSFVIAIVLMVLHQGLLSRTRIGHALAAVGGHPEAARLAGIRVGRYVVLAYTLSGCCAGVASLLLVARLTTATESLGNGLELTAIAAAVIGGVSLRGGTGTVWGPVLGAFLLGVVLLGLTLLGISQYVQQILSGVILLAAVAHARRLAQPRAGLQPAAGGA